MRTIIPAFSCFSARIWRAFFCASVSSAGFLLSATAAASASFSAWMTRWTFRSTVFSCLVDAAFDKLAWICEPYSLNSVRLAARKKRTHKTSFYWRNISRQYIIKDLMWIWDEFWLGAFLNSIYQRFPETYRLCNWEYPHRHLRLWVVHFGSTGRFRHSQTVLQRQRLNKRNTGFALITKHFNEL